MEFLSEYLKSHHPETFKRIIATETADLSAFTEPEIEAIAKRHLAPAVYPLRTDWVGLRKNTCRNMVHEARIHLDACLGKSISVTYRRRPNNEDFNAWIEVDRQDWNRHRQHI